MCMKRSNQCRLAALLCILSLMLASCGIPVTMEQNAQNEDGQSNGQQTIQDRTLRLAVYDFDTYHPLVSRSKSVQAACGVVYEPLYTTAKDGRAIPVLAQGFTLQQEGKEIQVKLKDGVAWHDGSALTVRDAVYSAKLAAAGETGSYQNIENAYAVDDSTVGIRFKSAVPNAASVLTFPIVKNNSAKDADKDYIPVGTGPYRYAVRDSVNSDIFEPFAEYHGQPGAFERVKIYFVNNQEEIINMFHVGEIDVLPEEVTPVDSFSVKNNGVMEEYTGNVMAYVGINFRNRIFWGVSTRRALANIIDKESIVSNTLYNKARPVDVPVSPQSWIAEGMEGPSGRSLEQAETLMAQDGWRRNQNGMFFRILSDGEQRFSIKLLVNQDIPQEVSVAQSIEASLNTFGIACSIDQQPNDSYWLAIQNKDYDIFLGSADLGVNMDYGQITPLGGNVFTYVDNEMDQLFIQLNAAAEESQIRELYGQYCKKIAEDVPYIPLFFKKAAFVHSAKINVLERGCFGTVLYDVGGWKLN